jgi:hypothetical protein
MRTKIVYHGKSKSVYVDGVHQGDFLVTNCCTWNMFQISESTIDWTANPDWERVAAGFERAMYRSHLLPNPGCTTTYDEMVATYQLPPPETSLAQWFAEHPEQAPDPLSCYSNKDNGNITQARVDRMLDRDDDPDGVKALANILDKAQRHLK